MTDIDLTPEAVERLADSYVLPGMPVDCRPVVTAATLRALSARLAEVEGERDRMWQANLDLQRKRDKAEAALATARAERDKWFEGAGAHHVASMREAQRADAAEYQRDQAKIALMHLERCAQVVSERGAQTGPQWTRLTSAILRARATMSKLPTPIPSNEPPIVQSALIHQQENTHE